MEDRKPFVEEPTKGLKSFLISFIGNYFLVILFAVLLIVSFGFLGLEISSNKLNLTATILASVSILVFFFLFFGNTIIDKLKSVFTLKALLYGVVGFAFFYLATILYSVFIYFLEIDYGNNENQEIVVSLIKGEPILAFIVVVILAPIVEEIMYRYALFGAFLKHNRFLAYFISVLAFTIAHFIASFGSDNILLELVSFFPYAFSGIVFAYIYEKSKNLGSAIIAHFINNFLSYIFVVSGLIFLV